MLTADEDGEWLFEVLSPNGEGYATICRAVASPVVFIDPTQRVSRVTAESKTVQG